MKEAEHSATQAGGTEGMEYDIMQRQKRKAARWDCG